ncbi:autotransporter domain-containing protein [Chlamydia vaughanii]|uniref:autotransporter domain-containing protein n=1 Tax=Chlamydia vaughanii TaxID=3112552 RepID=UPI0032B10ED8
MKHSVYWFLLSSGLVASTFSSFATPVEKNLDSSNSYNGNTTSDPFQPQSNSDATGTNYNCTGDICIAFAGTPTALTESCFNQTAAELFFTGNGHSLCFDNVNATNKPAAIEVGDTDKALSVTGFSTFSCTSCPPGVTGNGAIKSSGSTTFENDAKILFEKNCSSAGGGAICCKGLTLSGTSISASFINNKSTENGGAIGSTGATNILNNNGKLIFSTNTSTKAGGAIHSDSATTISNNTSVVFTENTATGPTDGKGGAITCTNTNAVELKLEGNKELIFTSNSSGTSGGAIHADKLIITTGGPTLFANNSVSAATPTGGAICINSTNGECSLTADLGDITFDGNTVTTTGNPASTKRNAIDLGTGGKFMKLDAREGRGIFFYDPIGNNGDANSTIEINKSTADATYTGSIVFSGERLTADEKAIADNLKSTFKQQVTLGAGTLVLRDGVVVEAKGVTQTAGSTVVMDVGTTLQAPSTNGESITLTNLDLNISSLLGGGGVIASPAKVEATSTDKTVTISSLGLVDADGNAYEKPVFSKTTPFDSALTIASAAAGSSTIPTDNLTGFVSPTHYGYQGNWTVTWTPGTTAATQSANLDWKQTGYNPNPERQGPLVPNTLWGAFSDIRALQNLMETSVHGSDFHRGFWVSAIGNFINKSGTQTKRKFRHSNLGYVLGALVKTQLDDVFSIALSQTFSRNKDYLVSKNASSSLGGSIYCQLASFWDVWGNLLQSNVSSQPPFLLSAQLSYSHTSNNMKTNMTTRFAPKNVVFPEIKGEWGNDCFAGELAATMPIDTESSSIFDIYTPFLKLQAIYARQKDFKENDNKEGRHFESSHLVNFSVPIGIKFERFSDDGNTSYNLALTYAPDIARSNPESTTSLLVSPTTAVWTTKATNLARQAFIVTAGSHLSLSPNLELFSQFNFELRGSSRNYNVNLGTKSLF